MLAGGCGAACRGGEEVYVASDSERDIGVMGVVGAPASPLSPRPPLFAETGGDMPYAVPLPLSVPGPVSPPELLFSAHASAMNASKHTAVELQTCCTCTCSVLHRAQDTSSTLCPLRCPVGFTCAPGRSLASTRAPFAMPGDGPPSSAKSSSSKYCDRKSAVAYDRNAGDRHLATRN